MTPEQLSDLHSRAFAPSRGWTLAEFAGFLDDRTCHLVTRPAGFALARLTLDEAELLTIATDPGGRRRGEGRAMLFDLLARLQDHGAARIFLEVAEDNTAARALYAAAGFVRVGVRPGYYQRANGAAVDALVLRRNLA